MSLSIRRNRLDGLYTEQQRVVAKLKAEVQTLENDKAALRKVSLRAHMVTQYSVRDTDIVSRSSRGGGEHVLRGWDCSHSLTSRAV